MFTMPCLKIEKRMITSVLVVSCMIKKHEKNHVSVNRTPNFRKLKNHRTFVQFPYFYLK